MPTPPAGDASAAERKLDMERIINHVLHLSVNGQTSSEVLETTLRMILTLDWLSFESRGTIMVTDPARPDVLLMETSCCIAGDLLEDCAEVPFGTCLCGRAAQKQEIIYTSCVDERHTIRPDEPDHGHYCVPMVVRGETVGVINLYVRSGHERSELEEQFLSNLAGALGGVIVRERTGEQVLESRTQLSAIVEAFDGLLYMVDADLRIEFMNERFCRLVGSDDPVGKLCYEVIHDRSDMCPWCTNDRVFAGETMRWEVQLKQDGRYYMVVNRPIVHASGAISKLSMATDITQRRMAERELEKLVDELEGLLTGVVKALASTTSQRDPYTAIHQERVARLACAIAEDLGLDEETVAGLRTAALLHDIGKISVPSEILSKPGTLNEMEMGIVRSHPSVGYELLEHVPFTQPIAKAVLQHHERLDGSGYPDGLRRDEILFEAKILAVADVVEAMASHRPYRPALGIDAALEEVLRHVGTRYDADVVEAVVRVVNAEAVLL